MFDSLLIANRGEIACRVLRTAKQLGLRTIAVYSDADAHALHVTLADEAVRIGPPAARDSYLNMEAILGAARATSAQAIHPGYGFLAENADFVAACAAAGLIFVGPPAAAMRVMGSKIGAKQLMEAAGVPLLPGYHGDDQDARVLERAATRIGFPLLVKASAGGGGKGMRIVHSVAELETALAGARREALKAFGDERVLLERYLSRPRHIEIQVFADTHGQCIHLNERDCSIQRRYQKVIEEAPAPSMTAERRAAMGAAAVKAAQAVGYVGAGTVEFIAAGDEFFFMEMNTRLQVEHPVTEMITGLDLVEWQLRIAAGESLPLRQDEVPLRGHALEARLYAEDPARDFVPSTGRLWHLRWPEASAEVRVDTGVRAGDSVTVHYDPMLAKVIVHAPDRRQAARRLVQALEGCEVLGVTTNLQLLHAVARHPQFVAGAVHTGFVAEHHDQLFTADQSHTHALLALAAVGWMLRDESRARGPWARRDGWRLNAPGSVELRFVLRDQPVTVVIAATGEGWHVRTEGHECMVLARFADDDTLDARVDGRKMCARWLDHGGQLSVIHAGESITLGWYDPAAASAGEAQQGNLVSPMPGQVLQVMVAAGAQVKRGQPLMIVEAMKMEHTITAPADGVVEAVNFAPGDRVDEGAQLLKLSGASSS